MAGQGAVITHVCIGSAQGASWLRAGSRSAIDKRACPGKVTVDAGGLTGDEQADLKHHGGPDQALYAYSQEDADHWGEQLSRDIAPGAFGENLRTTGVEVSGALIGERWRIGKDVEVQVSAPRIPCKVFSGFWDVPDLVKRFTKAGLPGAYLRVVSGGTISAGDQLEVLDRPAHDLTVAEVLRIMTTDAASAQRMLDVPELGQRGRDWAAARVGSASSRT